MARLFVISVRDSASDLFHAPLCVPALGVAERFFRDECNNPQTDFFKHPEDYELYLLGSFDNTTAELLPDAPRLLLRGVDAVRKPS